MTTEEIPNPKDITIEVTESDITYGEPSSYHFCPIALSIARHLSLKTEAIAVCSNGVVIQREGKEETYGLCCHGRTFVEKFDSGQDVKPGPIYLIAPRWREITQPDEKSPSEESHQHDT